VRCFLTGESFLGGGEDGLLFFATSLAFAGGLRLLEVSLPEEEDDLDLDLDDDPEYEDEPVVTDGDAAFGFTAGLAIVSTSLPFRP
jgi:hypothetical protein